MKQESFVLGFVLVACSVLQAQDCSSRMLRGTYAGVYKGWGVAAPDTPLAPFTLLDRITFTHTGQFTASATMSMGGQIMAYSAEGTMTVNPDCTTDATYMFRIAGSPPMGPGQSKCVVRNAGAAMECMPLNGVILGSLKKIPSGSICSSRTMKGAYAGSCTEVWLSTGDPTAPFTPANSLATLTYDHQGNYSGPATMSVGGTIVEGDYEGTVQVDTNCALSTQHVFHNHTLGEDEAETGVGLITLPGEEFYTISTVQGKVLSCVFKRVNRPGF